MLVRIPPLKITLVPTPQMASERRGAPFTFDAAKFVAAVSSMKETGEALLPSFDHKIGDPVEGEIRVSWAGTVLI
jgi:pantothenate kinase